MSCCSLQYIALLIHSRIRHAMDKHVLYLYSIRSPSTTPQIQVNSYYMFYSFIYLVSAKLFSHRYCYHSDVLLLLLLLLGFEGALKLQLTKTRVVVIVYLTFGGIVVPKFSSLGRNAIGRCFRNARGCGRKRSEVGSDWGKVGSRVR